MQTQSFPQHGFVAHFVLLCQEVGALGITRVSDRDLIYIVTEANQENLLSPFRCVLKSSQYK